MLSPQRFLYRLLCPCLDNQHQSVRQTTDCSLFNHKSLESTLTSLIIASVTSPVLARPPKSGVSTCPCPVTPLIALIMRLAAASSPRKSNIMAPLHTIAIGLEIPLPRMSGAEPCTGSNIDGYFRSWFMLVLGDTPRLEHIAPPRSVRISAKRFDATTTSSDSGASTKRAAIASTRTRSVVTSGNS